MVDQTDTTDKTAGSEGEEQGNNGASSGEKEITPDLTKTVPESDLLAVKSALEAKDAELQAAQISLTSERATRVAAEAEGAKVADLTKERDDLRTALTTAQETVNANATQRVEALRADLISRGASPESVKDLDESQLRLAGVFQPAAGTASVSAKGLDVSGRGQEDVAALSPREKLQAGIKEARQ